MRILFLTLALPIPPNDGARIRTFNLIHQLTRQHSVTLVTFDGHPQSTDELTQLKAWCEEIYVLPKPIVGRPGFSERFRLLHQRRPIALRTFCSPTMSQFLAELIGSQRYDLLHVNELYLADHARTDAIPRVMDHTDVEAEKQRRTLIHDPKRFRPYWWLRWIEHFQWCRYEVDVMPWFQAHSAVSSRDALFFQRHARGTPVVVVPNGVDLERAYAREEPHGKPTLIYVASMDYPPNVDAILWFSDQVLPLVVAEKPDVQLIVVGRNPPLEVGQLSATDRIVVTGTVPTTQPYYENAHVAIVPLRTGGGTRLKILEAMARGVPVVSTSIGCEGLDLEPGKDLFVADSPQQFAASVAELLNNPALRVRLAQHARRTVEERYDWQVAGAKLLQTYELAIENYQREHRASK